MISNQLGDLSITALNAILGRTIVGRLRIAFLSFMLISIAVAALVWKQMEQLSIVEGVIFESALPALRINQEIDRHIANVISYASAITSLTSLDKINEIHSRVEVEKELLSNLLSSNRYQVNKLTTEISKLVLEIDELTEELFTVVTQRSQIQSTNEMAFRRVQGVKIQFTLASEIEYLDSWGRLNSVIQSSTSSQGDLTESIASLGTHIEVESQILQLFVLIDSLYDSTTVDQLQTNVQRIDFITQNSAQALLSRPGTDTLIKFSQTLDSLGQILNGSAGMVASIGRRIQIENRRTDLSNDIIDSASRISALQREGIASTENAMSNAGIALTSAILRTTIICAFGFLIIISTALLISKVVIKKQIADRMSNLSRTVERLALGEVDIDVDTSGGDEISTIAKSLNKFKRNAKELLRSNADLERFAYIASHDLRAPIYAIQNLASWTIEDCKSKISNESLENLELILSRTKRMRELTGDLLKYAKLNEADQNICEFSCKTLCDDILDLVCGNCSFTFELDIPDQHITGPVTPIRQIIGNLVGNAIKHHDQETGHIAISMKVEDNIFLATIQDDGPGIPKAFQERIFEPFFRLESQDDVPGSGMGLAAVTRLVQTFEGSIELRSDPENRRGATFSVSILLPEKELHSDGPELMRSA